MRKSADLKSPSSEHKGKHTDKWRGLQIDENAALSLQQETEKNLWNITRHKHTVALFK